MIEIKDLYKTYDGNIALDGLNLCVPDGSIYGLVGTNGAGKSTLIKMMAGVLTPDKGIIEYDGQHVYENNSVKQTISFIPDDLNFANHYTIEELASIYSSLYNNWSEERFTKIINLFHLDKKRSIRTFSKGMKKQAMFAIVLATSPQYLLLDEPIDGLDPIIRKLVWKQIVDDVADRGTTVMISSHNLRDLESICDRVGIIHNGKTIVEKSLETMKEGVNKIQVAFDKRKIESDSKNIEKLNVIHREKRGSLELIVTRDSQERIKEVLGATEPLLLDILPLTLEEMFIYELGGDEYDFKDIM